MAKTNRQRLDALRDRREKIGQKRREYYLSDEEHEKVKKFVTEMRKTSTK